jgi:hypothetical protein
MHIMERRQFIRIVGGGVVFASSAGLLSSCGFGIPKSAVRAWNSVPPETELRRWVLSHALLAPNPHNMQPWIADLSAESEIALRLDTTRLLPETDPYGRQILMGCGAFLEILAIAAAERGYRADVALFPAGAMEGTLDGRAVATIRLVADANLAPDPLFKSVRERRTDRREYDVDRPVAPSDVAALSAAVQGFPIRLGVVGQRDAADDAQLRSIRMVASNAWAIELTTELKMMETMRVLRFGSGEIDRHRDGLVITNPMLVTLKRLRLLKPNKFPAPDSKATVSQIKNFNTITASTPSYLWLVTEGNTRTQQILAGRAYARLNLAGTALGLAMHPTSQALQEYPEVQSQYASIHALLHAPATVNTVQILARLGYPKPGSESAGPAPRRGIDALVATRG